MNRKLVRNLAVATLAAGMLGACASRGAEADKDSSAQWWKNNMRGYWYCVKRDATDFYRGIDRHFFNYDWEDPYMD
jgi:hypothetical protein